MEGEVSLYSWGGGGTDGNHSKLNSSQWRGKRGRGSIARFFQLYHGPCELPSRPALARGKWRTHLKHRTREGKNDSADQDRLSDDPDRLRLGKFQKESKAGDHHANTPMFTTDLFRMAKLWDEPRCVSGLIIG